MKNNFSFRTTAAIIATSLLAASAISLAAPAQAAPPSGAAWAVSLGDSYISGEGGRWAGNSSDAAQVDALGSGAYLDGGNAETIERCHRSTSAEIKVGGVSSLNLACSGSKTSTFTNSKGYFKPGLDFFDDGKGNIGQALALQQFAAKNKVSTVAVSVGGNDLNFASLVTTCVTKFLTTSSSSPGLCQDDDSVKANFTQSNVTAVASKISASLKNVRQAMTNAGYADSDYRIVMQNYPQPLPTSDKMPYPQSGFSRQSTYGCGFWNADLDWAAKTALPTINSTVKAGLSGAGLSNGSLLDISKLFSGHELCASGTKKLNDTSLTNWKSQGAADVSEWVNEIRTVSTAFSDYYIQESLHPNYWGQLALRGCLRQAIQSGSGGACSSSGTGLTSLGEPKVKLG